MIILPALTLTRVCAALGYGESLVELAERVVRALPPDDFGGVIAATFSNPERFPSLAVRAVGWLGLSAATPAFDIQMACSAYPYALYLAGRLAADTGKPVLVIDGDVQSPLVDSSDHATGAIFSDAVTATVVLADGPETETSPFAFLSHADEALACAATGPIRMDGFKVFTFVATEVSRFLKGFLAETGVARTELRFVPHQANPYMIRQLARSLELEDRVLTLDESLRNPGSCSIPLVLAKNPESVRDARLLLSGFGAGYSAGACLVRADAAFEGKVV